MISCLLNESSNEVHRSRISGVDLVLVQHQRRRVQVQVLPDEAFHDHVLAHPQLSWLPTECWHEAEAEEGACLTSGMLKTMLVCGNPPVLLALKIIAGSGI